MANYYMLPYNVRAAGFKALRGKGFGEIERPPKRPGHFFHPRTINIAWIAKLLVPYIRTFHFIMTLRYTLLHSRAIDIDI
jgi:hypothetical protein